MSEPSHRTNPIQPIPNGNVPSMGVISPAEGEQRGTPQNEAPSLGKRAEKLEREVDQFTGLASKGATPEMILAIMHINSPRYNQLYRVVGERNLKLPVKNPLRISAKCLGGENLTLLELSDSDFVDLEPDGKGGFIATRVML